MIKQDCRYKKKGLVNPTLLGRGTYPTALSSAIPLDGRRVGKQDFPLKKKMERKIEN